MFLWILNNLGMGGGGEIIHYEDFPEGGFRLGGSAPIQTLLPVPSIGGFRVGGASGAQLVIIPIPSGGLQLGGAHTGVADLLYSGSGGLSFGGVLYVAEYLPFYPTPSAATMIGETPIARAARMKPKGQ